MHNHLPSQSHKLDTAGIICSGACAVHCLLGPILVLASPALAHFLENEFIHIGLLVLLTPVAILAFYQGKKRHKKTLPVVLGGIGMVFLFTAIALEDLEFVLTVVGCIFLISAHIFNIRYLRLNS